MSTIKDIFSVHSFVSVCFHYATNHILRPRRLLSSSNCKYFHSESLRRIVSRIPYPIDYLFKWSQISATNDTHEEGPYLLWPIDALTNKSLGEGCKYKMCDLWWIGHHKEKVRLFTDHRIAFFNNSEFLRIIFFVFLYLGASFARTSIPCYNFIKTKL